MITFFSQNSYVPPAPTNGVTHTDSAILHQRALYILLVQKDGVIFINNPGMSRNEPVLQCGNMVISEGFSIELARYLKSEGIEILRFNKYQPLDKEVVEFLVDNDVLIGDHSSLVNAIKNSHASKEYRVFAAMKYT